MKRSTRRDAVTPRQRLARCQRGHDAPAKRPTQRIGDDTAKHPPEPQENKCAPGSPGYERDRHNDASRKERDHRRHGRQQHKEYRTPDGMGRNDLANRE